MSHPHVPARPEDLDATVAAAARGEEWAWRALVTAFRPTVLAVARRHRLRASEQDEVAQETWLRLFRSIGTIHTPAAIGGWLAQTARHEALRLLQQGKRELVMEAERLPEAATTPDLDARLAEQERRDALDRALTAVPGRQQQLLRMLLQNPTPSYEEISAELDMPIGSIGPSRARGIARLRGDEELQALVCA